MKKKKMFILSLFLLSISIIGVVLLLWFILPGKNILFDIYPWDFINCKDSIATLNYSDTVEPGVSKLIDSKQPGISKHWLWLVLVLWALASEIQ